MSSDLKKKWLRLGAASKILGRTPEFTRKFVDRVGVNTLRTRGKHRHINREDLLEKALAAGLKLPESNQ